MNFNFYLIKSLRIFLFPFSLLYGLIVIVRNYLYEKDVLKSVSFNLPVISVGNLIVGGTGKSPMVEYLIRLLQDNYKMATISRGYKRKTKGYILATPGTTALDIGDEPMQFYSKFPGIPVAVGEERIEAIPQLLQDFPETNVIVLDDAFQHRKIHPGLNILLTECNNLFTRDFFLPTGDLRDQRSSYKRADIIVVTKCHPFMSLDEKAAITNEIKPMPHQQIFFTTILYNQPYHIFTKQIRTINFFDEVLLVTGIANTTPIKTYIVNQAKTYNELCFSNHHIYTIDDLKEIRKRFNEINDDYKIIVTTEKDAVRLLKFKDELIDLPLFVLPVEHRFLFGDTHHFNSLITGFINHFPFNTETV